MSNLQPNCCLKFDFQKVDQHAGGKWLIHDTQTPQGQVVQWNIPFPWFSELFLTKQNTTRENKEQPDCRRSLGKHL